MHQNPFSALTGGAYDTPQDHLGGWEEGYPITPSPFPSISTSAPRFSAPSTQNPGYASDQGFNYSVNYRTEYIRIAFTVYVQHC